MKPSVDASVLRKRSEEAAEVLRQQEAETSEAQAADEQSFAHHYEVTSPTSADDDISLQDRLEAETRR